MKTVNADSFPFRGGERSEGAIRMGMGLYLAKKLPILTPALPLHPQGVDRGCKIAEAATTTHMGRELSGEVIA
jgi:hypothetical protein